MTNEQEEELLLSILPGEYEYKFGSYNVGQNSLKDIKFNIEARVNISNKKGLKLFLKQFNESSGCTFNIKSGRPDLQILPVQGEG